MVLVCLRGDLTKEVTYYLCKAHCSPLRPLCRDLALATENIFSDLKTQITNPPLRERVRQAWIYDETWVAMDARETVHWEGPQRTVRKLRRWISAGLSVSKI